MKLGMGKTEWSSLPPTPEETFLSAQALKRHIEMEGLLTAFVTQNLVCFCFTDAVLELIVLWVLLFIKHVG